ncbi:MAG: beta-galactosidase [Planctomycetes bacterium]|nr:beta-galactosidase [Planctomycetota bacterium]
MRILAMMLTVYLAVAAFETRAAEEALPVWPQPGARFPADAKPLELPRERTGEAVWDTPPAVISPYASDWYDYVPQVWGPERRISDPAKYFAALQDLYVRGNVAAGRDTPDRFAASRFPFYWTNLCNQLYIRNKSGRATLNAFKQNRVDANRVRVPSLEDPATMSAEEKRAEECAQAGAPLKPLGYDLRDEATYTNGAASPFDYDFSDVSLKHFRLWLRAKYGTLEALNSEWGSAFPEWDAVRPTHSDGLLDRLRKQIASANLASWADHREYNDDTFHAAIARYRAAVHKHDPRAPVGYSGTQMPSAWGGFDFWKMGLNLSWIEHYEVLGSREAIRSFMPRSHPALAAIPFKDVESGLRRMWYLVLHGDAGGLVWPYAGDDTSKTLLLDVEGDTVKPTELGRNLKTIFAEARSGVPCLLRRARPRHEPIAVLYSHASIRCAWPFEVLRDGNTWINRFSSYEGGHNYSAAGREGFYKLFEDLGYQYRLVSSRQVERGELVADGFKLAVLPRGIGLSAREVAGLRDFVDRGGVLVADLMPGRFNENGRQPETDACAELFGLKRAPFSWEEESKPEDEKRGYQGGFGRKIELEMLEAFHGLEAGEKLLVQGFQEPGLEAGAAQPLARTAAGPALLRHAIGKGWAFTLNFDLPNYLTDRAADKPASATRVARRLFAALLKQAGVEPEVQVRARGADKHPVGWEVFRYELGAADLIGVHSNGSVRIEIDLADYGTDVKAAEESELEIMLPREGFVTEMRTGKYFGKTKRISVRLEPGRPLLVSVLPYEVGALRLQTLGKIAEGKLPLKVSIEAQGELQDHVVHAELINAQGEAVPQSVVNLPLKNGVYEGAIDCSYVPGSGPWTLKLRDVASGKTAEASVAK